MSDGDFEVMPRGTMQELAALRDFANRMIAYNSIHDMPTPHEMRELIGKLELWYAGHNEKYSV
ncbi:hypothetical protein OAU13_00745 [bacterium]|nr:hypothetical protein [bacterium]